MIEMTGPQSEEARNNEANGVETDPILDKIAKSRGINLKKLLRTLKSHPDELTDKEQLDIIECSSAVLPRAMERMMIDKYRGNRDKLNELLFLHNTRAATRLATIYNGKYLRNAVNKRYNKEDFLAAARYGLWQGAIRFDLDRMYKGRYIKFITFATPWMFRYISEMLYEKENMIVHQSLDAKAFNDSNTTLGDMIAGEDASDGVVDPDVEFQDADTTQEPDDEENFGFSDADSIPDSPELLKSLAEADLGSITGPLSEEEMESPDLVKKQMDGRIAILKEMANTKPPADMGSAMELNEGAVSSIDRLCTEILNMRDPQERTITLFVGRRFIQAIVKHAAGREIPTSILNVNSMLKTVPGTKKKLLECLDLDEREFTQLCKHYTVKYLNRGIQ